YYRALSVKIAGDLVDLLDGYNNDFNKKHGITIDKSAENIISNVSSSKDKKVWQNLQDRLRATTGDIRKAYILRKTFHGQQQDAQMDGISLTISNHIGVLLEYIEYMYIRINSSFNELKGSRKDLEELKDKYNDILQIHETLSGKYININKIYEDLKNNFEENQDNERSIKKNCMVHDGFLDSG